MALHQLFPIIGKKYRVDIVLQRLKIFPGYCQLCSKWTIFFIRSKNLREDVFCVRCKSRNRQRQITQILIHEVLKKENLAYIDRMHGLNRLKTNFKAWNTESSGSLHNKLKETIRHNLIYSEYIANNLNSGEIVKNILHVDLCSTHFDNEEFDYIISSDVLEHVPDISAALKETYRVLKIGGSHIFTIPFFTHRSSIQTRAVIDENGDLKHVLKPWFHLDPLRKEGTLCFRVFAIEILSVLEKIGFDAKLINIHSTLNGILGSDGYVFVATKKKVSVIDKDPIESMMQSE